MCFSRKCAGSSQALVADAARDEFHEAHSFDVVCKSGFPGSGRVCDSGVFNLMVLNSRGQWSSCPAGEKDADLNTVTMLNPFRKSPGANDAECVRSTAAWSGGKAGHFFVQILCALAFCCPLEGLRGADSIKDLHRGEDAADPTLVGAIRWDAWYGTGEVVQWVEKTLGQPKYHFRLPWFAHLLGGDKVSINGDSAEVMEREISYAAMAGLNYWAFLNYWEDSPDLGIGLRRYLATKDKKGVRYCLVEEGGRLDKIGTKAWGVLVEQFRSPDYQKVLGGRPLIFVYIKPSVLGRADWAELKRQSIAAGLKAPYIVLMGWNLEQDVKDMVELGFDAVSAYARGGGYSMEQPSYVEQGQLLKKQLWDRWDALRIPCVTLASAGWDTRPRNERPPPWIKNLNVQPAPDPIPPDQQRMVLDSVTGTAEEVASHLNDAIQWTKQHREINPANLVIVYAWNEHDEGGWLQPTLGAEGCPNEERIKALKDVPR